MRGAGSYVESARGVTGDLVRHTREALAPLRGSDTVERAGYPDAGNRRFRAVRDGEVIGLAEFRPDGHGGWLPDETTRCSD